MLARLEQFAGLALVLVTLADIFLNVLYARAGIAIFSRPIAHGLRFVFVNLGRISGRRHARVLSFCGPVLVVCLILAWVSLLVVGMAAMMHPAIGHGIRPLVPNAGTDFVTAVNLAGGQMASVGPGPFQPDSVFQKLLFTVDGFLGISIVGLVITYLMQLYAALQARDELALKVELYSRQTGDAARVVAGLFPEGRFEVGYSQVVEMAAELSRVKEVHHLYPVLFYFRFPQPYYELSRVTLVLLDSVALIRAALEDEPAGWLKRSAGLEHLERGGFMLIDTLRRIYLADEGVGPEVPDPEEVQAWRARFLRGAAVLRAAGLPVRRDVSRCADRYVQLRNRWNAPVLRLGAAIGHRPREIDTALHQPDPELPPRAGGRSPDAPPDAPSDAPSGIPPAPRSGRLH